MTPGEVVARARRTAAHGWDAATYRAAGGIWKRAWTPGGTEIAFDRAPAAPLGFLTSERAELVRARIPDAGGLLTVAAEILDGRYRYFGYPAADLQEPIEYARDPFSERSWPARHGKRIDYRLAEHGDPKWIWELNRLQELPLLAASWLVSDDERYVRHGVGLVRRWIATAEPGRGIAWSNGFEAAMRAISLALFLDALRGSPFLDHEDAEKIVRTLWEHVRWIRRDPSTHSSANNHLVGELAGLVTAALLVPELTAGEEVLGEGLEGLAREAARQIASDGTSVEQAFRYHLFVLDHLLLVVALLDVGGRTSPSPIRAALERSAQALLAQLGESDPEPTYGDGDDGLVVRLTAADLRGARDVAAAVAARFGDPAARATADSLDATTCWLFGAAGAEVFARTVAARTPGSALLQDAGLVILRSGGCRVMFDAGPLGYLALAAHGHADALQVTLSDAGGDLVVDPGVGSYFARRDVRAAFRGTAAHPTVTVDGADQSEPGGPFLWARHASTRLVDVDLENGRAVAEHDGYRTLPDPVGHRRLVYAAGNGLVIVVDRLDGSAPHEIVQAWPLHPRLDAQLVGDVVHVTREETPRLLLGVQATVAGRLELHRGERDPLRGWYSARLEHLEPAWLATWTAAAVGPVEIVALLWPLEEAPWPDPGLMVERTAGELLIRYRDGDGNAVDLRTATDLRSSDISRA
jgi:hypothetical protein